MKQIRSRLISLTLAVCLVMAVTAPVSAEAAPAAAAQPAGSVLEAIEGTAPEGDAFAAADRLSRISGTPVPEAVEEVRRSPIRHTRECAVSEMEDVVKEILNL